MAAIASVEYLSVVRVSKQEKNKLFRFMTNLVRSLWGTSLRRIVAVEKKIVARWKKFTGMGNCTHDAQKILEFTTYLTFLLKFWKSELPLGLPPFVDLLF